MTAPRELSPALPQAACQGAGQVEAGHGRAVCPPPSAVSWEGGCRIILAVVGHPIQMRSLLSMRNKVKLDVIKLLLTARYQCWG